MPRIVKRSKLNREPGHCETCGKYCEKPYVRQIIPANISALDVIPYNKSAKKTKRIDLKGHRKAITNNYCNMECYEIRPFEHVI